MSQWADTEAISTNDAMNDYAVEDGADERAAEPCSLMGSTAALRFVGWVHGRLKNWPGEITLGDYVAWISIWVGNDDVGEKMLDNSSGSAC